MTKLFGGNYDAAAAAGAPASDWLGLGRLSRGSTLDSGDWDSCIRENCALIPSYSEALLLDQDDAEAEDGEHGGEGGEDEHRSLVRTDPLNFSKLEFLICGGSCAAVQFGAFFDTAECKSAVRWRPRSHRDLWPRPQQELIPLPEP